MRHPQALRTVAPAALVLVLASLAACGGGGGGSTSSATITAVTLQGTAKYGQAVTVKAVGTGLNGGSGLTLGSTTCRKIGNLASDTPATTAYFSCTITAQLDGNIQVLNAGSGAVLGSVHYTVPAPQVTVHVSNGLGAVGDMVFTLAPVQAPVTVDNFLDYVNAGFYANTIFHRVIPGFVVQGGGYGPSTGGVLPAHKTTNNPIALETNKGLHNTQWTLAMARGSLPDTATSEFFINLADNSSTLDYQSSSKPGYAVFGTVTTGSALAALIASAPHTTIVDPQNGDYQQPNPDVAITGALQTQ